MHNLEKLFDRGIMEPYKIPLLSDDNGLILEYTTIHHKEITHYRESKEYLTNLKICYKDTVLLDNIIDFERFLASLKIFIERRGYFSKNDFYFEEKKKDGISSLQLKFDTAKYIDIAEAIQINTLIYGALQGYSKKLLYRKYQVYSTNYISSEVDKKQNHMKLKNTVVVDLGTVK